MRSLSLVLLAVVSLAVLLVPSTSAQGQLYPLEMPSPQMQMQLYNRAKRAVAVQDNSPIMSRQWMASMCCGYATLNCCEFIGYG